MKTVLPSYVPPPSALRREGRFEIRGGGECRNATGCGLRTIGPARSLCRWGCRVDRMGGAACRGARAAMAIGILAAPRSASCRSLQPSGIPIPDNALVLCVCGCTGRRFLLLGEAVNRRARLDVARL
jgi:hypothetical protein